MSILKRTTTLDNPLKAADKIWKERKALPLPILSLQTSSNLNPKTLQNKKIKRHKPPIRENFKKMLEFLKKPERINECFPSNFSGKALQTRELVKKKMKTNFQFYQSKMEHLVLRTEITNALRKIEVDYRSQPEDERDVQLSRINLQRTIRFRKRSTKFLQTQSDRFMRWQSFCTSVSYHKRDVNRISTLQCKKKQSPNIRIKKRCQSTIKDFEKTDLINGWDEGPLRYATDVGRHDLNDIYQ